MDVHNPRFTFKDLLLTVFCMKTPDPCYIVFHDEEWGVPVHDDKYGLSFARLCISALSLIYEYSLLSFFWWYMFRKLFELLVLSGALAEHTWPTILSKRQAFRFLLRFWFTLFCMDVSLISLTQAILFSYEKCGMQGSFC